MLWKYYKNIVNVTLFLKFLPRFRQQHFFFPLIFGNDIAIIPFNFFPHFRQCHCHNYQKKKKFFFFPISAMALPQLLFYTGLGMNLGRGISVTALPKFLFFLSPTFSLSLSYFCWILATLLLKFFLFPQFPN